jgi:hypothetical protein
MTNFRFVEQKEPHTSSMFLKNFGGKAGTATKWWILQWLHNKTVFA